MNQEIILITTDGYGKRMAVADIRKTGRNRKGVQISKAPLAAAITITHTNHDLVLASAGGKIQVIAVADLPLRRRTQRGGPGRSRGARVMTLSDDDYVAGAALAPPDTTPGRDLP